MKYIPIFHPTGSKAVQIRSRRICLFWPKKTNQKKGRRDNWPLPYRDMGYFKNAGAIFDRPPSNTATILREISELLLSLTVRHAPLQAVEHRSQKRVKRGLFEPFFGEFRSAFFGEERREAEGLHVGWPFFWLLFFGHPKKSSSPSGEKGKSKRTPITKYKGGHSPPYNRNLIFSSAKIFPRASINPNNLPLTQKQRYFNHRTSH